MIQAARRISRDVQELLRCPVCSGKLELIGAGFACTGSGCAGRFPIVDGVPVLINEKSSLFAIADIVSHRATSHGGGPSRQRSGAFRRLRPAIGRNIKGKPNFERLRDLLSGQATSPRVLVVGGRILGHGMEVFANDGTIDLVESDVSFGDRTTLICDAHDIPFDDESFDGVIAQAVLEHVVDPYKCCEEIHRVLKKNGVVYAETPFMQQVHSRYDFTRFTRLGHRRLFRRFDEIDSGAVGGPGMALAWSYKYFLLSGAQSPTLRKLLRAFAGVTSFHLKYFDHLLIDKPGALDAASAYYFMGRKTERTLPDRELAGLYKGGL